jgi:acetyl esterase/lipase
MIPWVGAFMNSCDFPATRRCFLLGLCGTWFAPFRKVSAREPGTPRIYDVESFRNLAYFDGPGADYLRHRCDVFAPKGCQNCPVVVLVHGGVWTIGDKSCIGLYSAVGKFLARNGIVAVLPNYRLWPWVKHPEHVKDVARAFSWTVKHCGNYGGSADNIFLVGHSAGGHLVALLATDETYLKAEGLSRANIRGVMPICGVYRIPEIHVRLDLDPEGNKSGIMAELASLSTLHIDLPMPRLCMAEVQKRRKDWLVSPFSGIFGDDPKSRETASPLTHVQPGLPPFRILYAEHELPTLAPMAEEFGKALKENGCEVEVRKIPHRSHQNIVFHATSRDDAVADAMLDFVRNHTR